MPVCDKQNQTYSIKQLSKEFDVTPRTLRHYEEQGLLSPDRIGQNRVYQQADRTKLAWILRARRVGFSLSEVAEMLDLYNLDDGRSKQRAVTLEKCQDRLVALKAQRDDLNETIEELDGFCTLLENLVNCPDTGKLLDKRTGTSGSLENQNPLTAKTL